MPTTDALCAQLLPTEGDLWHSTDPTARARAKHYCNRCPLQPACQDAGLARPDNRGIWGGLDTRQRQRLRGVATGGPNPDNAPNGPD